MSRLEFSFKAEPIWMLILAVGPGVLALLVVLFLVLILKFVR